MEQQESDWYAEARATVAYAIARGWAKYPEITEENIMPPRGKIKGDEIIEPPVVNRLEGMSFNGSEFRS